MCTCDRFGKRNPLLGSHVSSMQAWKRRYALLTDFAPCFYVSSAVSVTACVLYRRWRPSGARLEFPTTLRSYSGAHAHTDGTVPRGCSPEAPTCPHLTEQMGARSPSVRVCLDVCGRVCFCLIRYSDTLRELGVEDHFADADLKGWSGEATGAAYASVNTDRSE